MKTFLTSNMPCCMDTYIIADDISRSFVCVQSLLIEHSSISQSDSEETLTKWNNEIVFLHFYSNLHLTLFKTFNKTHFSFPEMWKQIKVNNIDNDHNCLSSLLSLVCLSFPLTLTLMELDHGSHSAVCCLICRTGVVLGNLILTGLTAVCHHLLL